MPKILGLNLLGVAEADFEGDNQAVWMAGGFVITVMQVIGIGLVLKWKGAASLSDAIKTVLLLWLFLALPFAHYGYLYGVAHSQTLLVVDATHLLAGWLVSGVALTLIK